MHLVRNAYSVVQLYGLFTLGDLLFDIFEKKKFKRDPFHPPVTLASHFVI